MSRKKKTKPTPVVAGGAVSAGPADLAEVTLAAARYKDAIEQFKELLKRERRPEWLEGLAAAYAGRAEQLAAKGMIKEALALWRTRSDACNVPLLDGRYVGWLLKNGQVEQALGFLAAVEKLPPEAQAAAQTQLAPAVLVAPDALLAGLAADSPVLQHRAAARAALAACAHGDEAALAAALQAISFRSPYRDLRPLLRALSLHASDPQQAASALARVPEKGPFEPLAQVLQVCLMPAGEWLAGLRGLDEAGRTLVLDLKGCPPAQRALVLDLMARTGDAPTPVELFDLAMRHCRAMTGGIVRPLCLRLLPHAPQRLDAFRANLPPLAAAEQERVLALAAELKQDPDRAEPHWLRLVKLLSATPATSATPAGQQRAALVLRRLADEHSHHSPDGSLCAHAQDWLAQSLKLDPADRATHLRLVRDARLHGSLKQARSLLDAARERFPDDAPLLQEAVEVALAAGAFKKAAGLAKQVLQLDPINPRVRTLIGRAHLSHARKQIDAHNRAAARRELDEAATWLRSADERGLVRLLQGFAAESAAAADSLWHEAVAELGPLLGAFHLLMEGGRSGLEARVLLGRAGVDLAAPPSVEQTVALAQGLNLLPERDRALHAVLAALRGMLERAAGALHLSESEHVLVCEALLRHEQQALTRRFAKAALERWPQRPVFVYLDAAAQYGAQPWRMPRHEWQRLDRVFEQAQDEGDQRTARRLSKLLGAAAGPDDDDDDGFPADLGEPGAAGIGDAMDMIEASGGEDAFLDVARRRLGKAAFDRLRRDVGGNKKQLAQALAELLLVAEQELKQLPPPRAAWPNAAPKPAPKAAPKPAPKTPAVRILPPATLVQPDLFDD